MKTKDIENLNSKIAKIRGTLDATVTHQQRMNIVLKKLISINAEQSSLLWTGEFIFKSQDARDRMTNAMKNQHRVYGELDESSKNISVDVLNIGELLVDALNYLLTLLPDIDKALDDN